MTEKNRSTAIHYKTKAYSATALAFLAAYSAEAQVVLTDIDPDETYSAPDGVFYLDLDNDGTDDFVFSASSAAAFLVTDSGTNQYLINGVFGSPYGSNEILIDGAFSGFAYPAVLHSMDVVGASDVFSPLSFQTLAYSFRFSDGGGLLPLDEHGQWLGGFNDQYIGLRIQQNDGVHYGWLRLSVGSDNKSFTVSMYGYDATPDAEIHTDIREESASAVPNWSIYSYGSVIHFISHEASGPGYYQVYDLQGRLVLTGSTDGLQSTVEAGNLSGGIYLVRLQTDSGVMTRKLYLN